MSKRKQETYANVLTKNPHIQSRAALILLTNKYRSMLKKYPPKWRIWLSFRNRFLKKQLKKGLLECYYCGLKPLYKNSKITPDELKATIDHFHPRSKGGNEFDESNLVVSCLRCNQKKGDKVLKDNTR